MFQGISAGILKGIAGLKMGKCVGHYAVRVGRKVGVFDTWNECKAQVDKFPGARYKKFPTEQEAWDFTGLPGVGGAKNSTPQCPTTSFTRAPLCPADLIKIERGDVVTPPSTLKRVKRCSPADGGDGGRPKKRLRTTQLIDLPLPTRVKVEPSSPTDSSTKSPTNPHPHVYTDGSCTSNGRRNANAGIGVFWGPSDLRNLSEKLEGRQTNQRAEIWAAIRAIEQAKEQSINIMTILTDSQFVINCVTKWQKNWKRNGWKLQTGGPVKNKEDLEYLSHLCQEVKVIWKHVKGHSGNYGNEMADKLAVAGGKTTAEGKTGNVVS